MLDEYRFIQTKSIIEKIESGNSCVCDINNLSR